MLKIIALSYKMMTVIGVFLFLSFPTFADILIENPWIRASTGPNAALFVTLLNTSDIPEKLIGAKIEGCHHAELHTHVKENDIFRMREVEFIDLPAFGRQDLKPGGYHVMLMKIAAPLQKEEEIFVTLFFENSQQISFTAPIKGGAKECCH